MYFLFISATEYSDQMFHPSHLTIGNFFVLADGSLSSVFLILTFLIGFAPYISATNILPRLNYGVIFQREATLTLSREYWLHTYEINLPEHVNFPAIGTCQKNTNTCQIISHVLTQLNSIRIETDARLKNTLETVNKLVPHSSIVEKSRSKRSLLPFIGKFAKTLFGTATVNDVNVLAKHINALNKRTTNIADALVQHGQHMSSFMVQTNERMNNLLTGVKENHLAIQYIHYRHNLKVPQDHFNKLLKK